MDIKENPRPGVAVGRGVGIAAGHGTADPITPPGESQRDRAHALLTALRASYPVLGEYRPLSIGIRAAVHAALPGETRKIVNRALAIHCRSDRYLRALAAGGPRCALDGTPAAGEVSEPHCAAAALVLERRAEKAVKPPRAPVAGAAPKLPLLRPAKRRRP